MTDYSYLTNYTEEISDDEQAALNYLANYNGTFAFLLDVKSRMRNGLSPRQVAAVLRCKAQDEQRATARVQRPTTPSVTEDGMYRTADGTIYKVQKAIHGSGRLYAKKLVVHEGEFTFTRGFQGTRVTFEYEAGAIFNLTPEDKMSLEQAREFGALYGTCCVCGRTLTDERSIANGIGPVCEGRWS